MLDGSTLTLSPLLPLWVLIALGAGSLLVAGLGVLRGARGAWLRILALATIMVALVNPALIQEERDPIQDVGVIVVDSSASQRLAEREDLVERAAAHLRQGAEGYGDLDIRVVRVGAGQGDEPAPGTVGKTGTVGETRLFSALSEAIADVPRRRLSGAMLITDGQVHDVSAAPADIGPIHALITGERDAYDRRLSVTSAPSYGLVGDDITLTVRVDDLPDAASVGARAGGGDGTVRGAVDLTITVDGERSRTVQVPLGEDREIPVPIRHGGENVIELEVPEGPQSELTLANNRAALTVNGVRDRLRVLLVSGEPHPGERTWRRLLKADPSVDLIHFTILRPPSKQDNTPIDELSLIAFPIRQLFEVSLNEFDLVIFDRYKRRGVLPSLYFRNIAEYVRQGGALLDAVGPSFADHTSLYNTALREVLPAAPTGQVFEEGYRPRVSDIGRRHPVTAPLMEQAGEDAEAPQWGRWFRHVDARAQAGDTLMTGANGAPLLQLSRVGDGRVAQIMSDHIWLWARGYEGGGPQGPMLRRVAHWLMKQPELEENALRASVDGTSVTVTRRMLQGEPGAVTIDGPEGDTRSLSLSENEPGVWRGRFGAETSGIYRITQGDKRALAVVGELNPPELRDLRATGERLSETIQATGGGMVYLDDQALPEVRRVQAGRAMAGETVQRPWLAWRDNGGYVVTGVSQQSLLPPWAAVILLLGTAMLAWWREGR